MRTGALVVFAVLAIAGAGVALWVSNKIPFIAHGPAGSPDPGDAQPLDAQPLADASSKAYRKQASPLSSAQLGAPLVHGAWVTACGAPDTMKVTVKLDVRQGRAVKIDVKTDPPDPVVTGCVERAATDLRWDISPKTDHVTVRY
jgi:hypothetical protein